MAEIEQRLARLGLQLPPSPEPPPGFKFSFSWVRLSGNRAFLSGHGALAADGTPIGPFGKVPSEVSLEQAKRSARGAALAGRRWPCSAASKARSVISIESPRG